MNATTKKHWKHGDVVQVMEGEHKGQVGEVIRYFDKDYGYQIWLTHGDGSEVHLPATALRDFVMPPEVATK